MEGGDWDGRISFVPACRGGGEGEMLQGQFGRGSLWSFFPLFFPSSLLRKGAPRGEGDVRPIENLFL